MFRIFVVAVIAITIFALKVVDTEPRSGMNVNTAAQLELIED